jgi:dTDP-4-dehydrorhamnose reductase
MKLLVTGATGLLGSEVVRAAPSLGWTVAGLARHDLDVTDGRRVEAVIRQHGPDAVVHCAAFTAVDAAETEAARAMAVNGEGAGHVARAARSVGAVVVYVSTDFVFDGKKGTPYTTSDAPAPLGVYGLSKLAGEGAVAESGARYLIVRTGWLYGAGGRNFVDTVLERARRGEALRVVDDQRGRPSWALHVADGMLRLLEGGAGGIWNLADRGDATWHELATEAVKRAGLTVDVSGVTTEAWGAPAPRPSYSVLDITATEAFLGRRMVSWPEALARYLHEG